MTSWNTGILHSLITVLIHNSGHFGPLYPFGPLGPPVLTGLPMANYATGLIGRRPCLRRWSPAVLRTSTDRRTPASRRAGEDPGRRPVAPRADRGAPGCAPGAPGRGPAAPRRAARRGAVAHPPRRRPRRRCATEAGGRRSGCDDASRQTRERGTVPPPAGHHRQHTRTASRCGWWNVFAFTYDTTVA